MPQFVHEGVAGVAEETEGFAFAGAAESSEVTEAFCFDDAGAAAAAAAAAFATAERDSYDRAASIIDEPEPSKADCSEATGSVGFELNCCWILESGEIVELCMDITGGSRIIGDIAIV